VSSVESLGSVFRKLLGYMECISIERELVAQISPPPNSIFAAGIVLCIDQAMAWTLSVSSLLIRVELSVSDCVQTS
jgi:hypothetical protein